jgi:hypothetical protein
MPSIASPLAGQRFVWTTFWNSGTSSISASATVREHKMCKMNIAAVGRTIMPHEQLDGATIIMVMALKDFLGKHNWRDYFAVLA